MPSVIQQLVDQIDADLSELAPVREGFKDYMALELMPSTREQVGLAAKNYDDRLRLLIAAKTALMALMTDGFPLAPSVPTPTAEAIKDLRENAATIAAALGRFNIEPFGASELGLKAGDPVPK